MGIGTTAPTFALETMGTNTIDGFAVGNLTAGSAYRASISAQYSADVNDRWMKFNSNWFSVDGNSRAFSFFRGSNEYLTILNNGRIGIGTATPNADLEIVGNQQTIAIETQELLRLFRPHITSTRNATSAAFKLGSYETGLNGKSRLDFLLSGFPDSSNGWGATPDISVMTLLANGNVGIGTTSPLASLHLSSNYGGWQGGLLIDNTGTDGRKFAFASRSDYAGSLGISDETAGFLRVIITSSGNFGIATTNPTEKLDVAGNIRFSGAIMPNNSAGTVGQVLTSAGAGAPPTWSVPSSATNIYNTDGTLTRTRTLTLGTGNDLRVVGSNTQSLELRGPKLSSWSDMIINANSDGGATLGVEHILMQVRGNELMRIQDGGNVGIGTTTPTTKLDVNGVARAATFTFPNLTGDPAPVITSRTVPTGQGEANEKTELILFHSNDSSNGSGDDQITLRSPALSFQTYTNTLVADINNNAGYNERVRILPNGNVGIGTSTPTQPLDVAGNIKFSGELKPNNNSGATGEVLMSLGTGAAPVWKSLSEVPRIPNPSDVVFGVFSTTYVVPLTLATRSFGSTVANGLGEGTIGDAYIDINPGTWSVLLNFSIDVRNTSTNALIVTAATDIFKSALYLSENSNGSGMTNDLIGGATGMEVTGPINTNGFGRTQSELIVRNSTSSVKRYYLAYKYGYSIGFASNHGLLSLFSSSTTGFGGRFMAYRID